MFLKKYRKNRIDIEVTRGCKWNCKFCQVCRFYKYSEIPYDELVDKVASVPSKDWKHYKLGLVAADLMSYSYIRELFDFLYGQSSVRQIGSFSVSSHPSSLVKLERILEDNNRLVFRNISIGVEGSSERLRELVNKPLSNSLLEEIINIIAEDQFVKSLRLHFIKGLPTETEDDYNELITFLEEVIPLPNNFPLRISFVQFVPMVGSYWQYKEFIDGDELYNNVFRKWYKDKAMWKKGLILEKSMMSRGKWIEWMINKGGEELNNLFDRWSIQYEGTVRKKFYDRFVEEL